MEGCSVSATNRKLGICPGCALNPRCSLRRDKSTAVWFCESFQCAAEEERGVEPIDIDRCASEMAGCRYDSRFKGLCMNCENREKCTYPKPEGGVWHCSEYK